MSGQSKFIQYVVFITLILSVFFIVDSIFYVAPAPVMERHKSENSKIKKDEKKKESKATTDELISSEKSVEPQPEITEEPVAEKPKLDPKVLTYFDELVLKNTGRKTRSDIVVRYYRHAPDGNKLDELKKFGLYIHERPIDGSLENYESNSIYYGDSVSTEDIQLIAFIMLQKGFPLKIIQPSIYHDNWKANSIEIGTDTLVSDKVVLTLTELRKFSNKGF